MRKFYAVFAVLSALGFNANAQDNFTVHDFKDAEFFIDLDRKSTRLNSSH